MSVLKSFCLAFSMFSKIPSPKVEWTEENRKYLFCFFPCVGAVVGAGMYVLWLLRLKAGIFIPFSVFALVGTVFPILITGGIHMDGFLDTMDAIHSYQSRERKLEILKDSHVGAFACISLACYLLLYGAAMYLLLDERQVIFLAVGFILSRTLSGLAILTVEGAKKEGLLYTMSGSAGKRVVLPVLFLWIFLSGIVSCYLCGIWGIGCIAVSLAFFLYYIHMARRSFGGLTGDLAGWFVTVYELLFVWFAGVAGYLWSF